MKKAVIGLSGGMDSATLLGVLISEGYEVHCCSFTYGSKHNEYELKAAQDLINYFNEALEEERVFNHSFNLEEVFKPFQSNLLKSGGEIPEGHYEAENMKLTVVPGRNTIFASIMAGLAESIGAEIVALGVHAGDHAIYPDCRADWRKAIDLTIFLSTDKKVQVYTPFIHDNKESILRIGYSLQIKVPYHLTRTCYKDQEASCGKCGSCQERLEAFNNLNIKDTILYE